MSKFFADVDAYRTNPEVKRRVDGILARAGLTTDQVFQIVEENGQYLIYEYKVNANKKRMMDGNGDFKYRITRIPVL